MNPFFQACIDANREISNHLVGGLSASDRHKSMVGAGGDISSGIDLYAESIFVKHLSRFGRIESEESGVIGSGEHTLVIDPLDGSSNILSNFPYYGTSVAYLNSDGVTIMAAVCNLATDEIYLKETGLQPLSGSLQGDKFSPFVISLDSEIGLFERAYAHPDVVRLLGENSLKFRAPGAVALSLVYARNSRYFLYVGRYRSYDLMAGLLFCEDLEVIVNEEYVIVTQNKQTLTSLETILAEYRGIK